MSIIIIFIALLIGLPLFAMILFPFFLIICLPVTVAITGSSLMLLNNRNLVESVEYENLREEQEIAFNFMGTNYYKMNSLPGTASFSQEL